MLVEQPLRRAARASAAPETDDRRGDVRPLRIALCQPMLRPFLDVLPGRSTEAAYLQQSYIAAGLTARGHQLTYVGPEGLADVNTAIGDGRSGRCLDAGPTRGGFASPGRVPGACSRPCACLI